jgi:hypothetical protein
MRNLGSGWIAIGPAALLLLAGCVENVPAHTHHGGAAINETYAVTAINGRAPAPAVGRGNSYEVMLMGTAVSVSLGCSNIAVSGVVADGVFRASDPVGGGVVTGAGTCGIPAEQQWEPQLRKSLLAGEVRVTRRANAVTLAAPNLVVEGRSR